MILRISNRLRHNSGLVYCLYGIVLTILMGFSINNNKEKSITVLTYDIHHALGMDNVLDIQRIANIIIAENPDIVALKGVDIIMIGNEKVHQLQELGRLTKMNFIFGKSMDGGDGEYGNGILTKFDVVSQETYALPGERRCALVVTLNINDEEIAFVSAQLDNKKGFKEKSIPFIETILVNYMEMPLIFAGDLNATSDSNVIKSLSKNLTNVILSNNTAYAEGASLQNNYIMYSPAQAWKVLSSSSVVNELIISDYRPLKAKLFLN